MEDKRPLIAAYMMANRPFGAIYIGVTSNLYHRTHQHRTGQVAGHTKRYGCGMLVWYEPHAFIVDAIRREKALKRWNRPWKMQLIEQRNPEWKDLYPSLCGEASDPRIGAETDGGVAAFLAQLEVSADD